MKRLAIIVVAAAVLMSGCVGYEGAVMPYVTMPPDATPTPEPTPTPTPTPEATPMPEPEDEYAMGEEYWLRYLAFKNVLAYEENDDTFVDAVIESTYDGTIACAVSVVFYLNGEAITEGKFSTRDGQYLLVLEKGETAVYARVDTDMSIYDLDYELVFSDTVGGIAG